MSMPIQPRDEVVRDFVQYLIDTDDGERISPDWLGDVSYDFLSSYPGFAGLSDADLHQAADQLVRTSRLEGATGETLTQMLDRLNAWPSQERQPNLAALKRRLMPPAKNQARRPSARVRDFVDYLENRLIPDLEESGQEATAEDFETLAKFLRDPELTEADEWSIVGFVSFLENTLIPDLKASGREFTAADFQRGVRMLRRQKRV